ncbi:MAG: FTR1 family iron permease [Betaproteobacteria bacterium]
MLEAFVITLREGLEAFLIVAISLSYLKKSGQANLARAVHWGIGTATLLSLAGGYLLYNAANQEWLDGPLAIVAAVSVTWMIVHMWRAGRRMKRDIEGRLQSSSAAAGAFVGVFLFTVLMVTREGMETALLLLQLRETLHLAAGAALGVAGAAGVAWLWSRYGSRVNLTLFFQATAIFLFVFVVQLTIRGVHEMAEQHLLPYSTIIHQRTESWGPDSPFGHMLTYSLVVLPAVWLAIRSSIFKPRSRSASVPQSSAVR